MSSRVDLSYQCGCGHIRPILPNHTFVCVCCSPLGSGRLFGHVSEPLVPFLQDLGQLYIFALAAHLFRGR